MLFGHLSKGGGRKEKKNNFIFVGSGILGYWCSIFIDKLQSILFLFSDNCLRCLCLIEWWWFLYRKRLFNCCNCIWRIRWLRILLAVQFVTELCLKWKEFFFFGGNMLFNCLKWKAIFLLGTYWVCVSEREKERCWCWGIKVITYSCFFFFW